MTNPTDSLIALKRIIENARQIIDNAEALMGDASTRKDEGCTDTAAARVPPCGLNSPANLRQGEISVSDAEKEVSDILQRLLVNEAIDCLTINIEQIMMLLRPYLATREPVSVSLEKCGRAAYATGYLNSWTGNEALVVAKAVLDAAK
jgi:hypothetical protein